MVNVIHLHTERTCPVCGHRLNASAVAPDADDKSEPKPGDFTVCSYCAYVLVFIDGNGLRRASSSELDKLDPDTLDALDRFAELARARKVH